MLSPIRPGLLVAVMAMWAAMPAYGQVSLTPNATARPPDGGDPRLRRPDRPDYRQYDYGRELYAVKLGCESCPLGERPLDEGLAKRFLVDESLRFSLSADEEAAVTVFLKQRFGLP